MFHGFRAMKFCNGIVLRAIGVVQAGAGAHSDQTPKRATYSRSRGVLVTTLSVQDIIVKITINKA